MYNKSKPHQSIKVEKETENIKLRKTIKSLSTDKHLINKRETVWDRLSKAKKVSSTENVSRAARSRPNISIKNAHRSQPINLPTKPLRRPLIPTFNFLNKRPSLTQGNKPIAHDFYNPTFWQVLPAKEIIAPCNLSSRSSEVASDRSGLSSTHDQPLDINDQRENSSSEESNEEYTLAPLLNSSSSRLWESNEKPVALEDIELVRNVVKSNSRYKNLEKNPHLLKDILKTQLQNISMHEQAVKKTLDKLESSTSLHQSSEVKAISSTNNIVNCSAFNGETNKFEVEVIFNPVPSLRKEIEILKTLGEKLEATLNFTTSYRNWRDAASQISIDPLLKADTRLNFMYAVHDLIAAEHYAQVAVRIIGFRQCIGIVNEFRMAQKSIVELKSESNRPFYIQRNSGDAQLVRTSFKELKETPNELLRYVKPKNSQVAFNVLDQDPIFFYNAFNKLSNKHYILYTKQNQCKQHQHQLPMNFHKDGETIFWSTSNRETSDEYKKFLVDKKEPKENKLFTVASGCDTDNKLFSTTHISEPGIRAKRRTNQRRRVTPMPIDYYYCPKNSLVKTVLVGLVQMSVFIIFIMALTYPNVRC